MATALCLERTAHVAQSKDMSKNISGSQYWMLTVKPSLKNCLMRCVFFYLCCWEESGTGHQTHGYYVPEAIDSFWNGGEIAGGPFVSCVASAVSSHGRSWLWFASFAFIMDTSVSFGHRPEVASFTWMCEWGNFRSLLDCDVGTLSPGQWEREGDFMGSKLLSVQMDTGHSRLLLFSVLPEELFRK